MPEGVAKMRTFLTCIAAGALFASAPVNASVVEHRPIKGMGDLSIAPPDIPVGCKVLHSYGAKETGGVFCGPLPANAVNVSGPTDPKERLEFYFAISPNLNPDCKAEDNGWSCTFTK